MRVISASRRTDLPAFYTPWLMKRITSGYCHWSNPFSGQVYRVSLLPQDVIAMMFITRNPSHILKELPYLDKLGYRYYFHMTITGYDRLIDQFVPDMDASIELFKRTSDAVSPQFIHWRYDPVLISETTTREYHIERFTKLCQALSGYTQRCYISFVQFYAKTERNLGKVQGLAVADPPAEDKSALAITLAETAKAFGIEIYACCSENLVCEEIRKGACLDGELIKKLRPDLSLTFKNQATRQGCGCIESTDIGAFDTCLHGCTYCYATSNYATSQRRHGEHDPDDSILWRPPALRGVDLETVAKELSQPHSHVTPISRLELF